MKQLRIAFALLALAAPAAAQQVPRSTDAVLSDMEATAKQQVALVAELRTALSAQVVPAGGDVQAALNKGGDVYLTAGATYPGTFTLKTDKTALFLNGAKLTGSALGPALQIDADDTYVSGGELNTGWDQSVVHIGYNDTRQVTVDSAPARTTLVGLRIVGYRGKRAVEVNGSQFAVKASTLGDIYDPAGRDSQAIAILNAPCAPCIIDGNDLSAGSENIMVGGDTMKIKDVNGVPIVATDIRVTGNNIWKPLSWQTDGINRGVKNLLELKAGVKVFVSKNTMDGSWKAAQDGYCFAITPRNSQVIADVIIEDNTCAHVGGGFNIMGVNDSTPTPAPVSGLVIRRNNLNIDHIKFGGRGILALITQAPHDVTFDSNVAIFTGGEAFYLDKPGSHPNADGTRSPNDPMVSLAYTNNYSTAGTYGFVIGGATNSTAPMAGVVSTLTITGNTIADANSWVKKYFPTNTFVTRAALDALLAAH